MFRRALSSNVGALVFGLVVVVSLVTACGGRHPHRPAGKRQRWLAAKGPPPLERYSTKVRLPADDLGLSTGRLGSDGKPVRVRCGTCHTLERVQAKARAAKARQQPGSVHGAIRLTHAKLTCRSCHQSPRFERFKLTNGKTLVYAQVMQLCGQCHGRQHKDYLHGAHGGMNGYWDLSRGPRVRNHCIVCHDPHRPAITAILPAPRARYRFLDRVPKAPTVPKTAKRQRGAAGGPHGSR